MKNIQNCCTQFREVCKSHLVTLSTQPQVNHPTLMVTKLSREQNFTQFSAVTSMVISLVEITGIPVGKTAMFHCLMVMLFYFNDML